jgi:hypothetical protein
MVYFSAVDNFIFEMPTKLSHAFQSDHATQFTLKVLIFGHNVHLVIVAIGSAIIVSEPHNTPTYGRSHMNAQALVIVWL